MRLDWLTRIILRLRGRLAAPYGPVAVLTSSGAGAPAPQLKRQPDGAELLKDVAPASWIAERLQRSTRQTGTLVGCVIPEGFEAYARIFHPARYQSEDLDWHKVSWSTVASWSGKVVHPQMEFSPIANLGSLRGCVRSLGHVLEWRYETQTIPQRPDRRTVGCSGFPTPISQDRGKATYCRLTGGRQRHCVRSAQRLHVASHAA